MSAIGKVDAPAQADLQSDSAAPQVIEVSRTLTQPTPEEPPSERTPKKHKMVGGLLEQKSLWNTQIIGHALVDAFKKLDPRWMIKNPVMFVVEIGSLLTSALLVDNLRLHRPGFGFNLQITLWLWFTVLFANFAEAMAEGRGKAQADTLRKAKGETIAKRYSASGSLEDVASGMLRAGDDDLHCRRPLHRRRRGSHRRRRIRRRIGHHRRVGSRDSRGRR